MYCHFLGFEELSKPIESDKKRGPKKHCCPWILVEVVGQEVGLSGAVFADGVPCIQPLSCNVPFLHAPMSEHLRISQLRLCKALWVGATLLWEWYEDPLQKAPNDQAQFPYLRAYTDSNGAQVSFTYVRCMKARAGSVFVAKSEESSGANLIVKFVESYGEDVHRKLSDAAMAPRLHAIETAHTFRMVVMDFENNARIWDPVLDSKDSEKTVQLQSILTKLKEGNFVHGDLRPNNLLVCSDGTVKLIDFDWAGQDGSARYPVELNPEVGFPCDASVGGMISMQHDEYMLGKLLEDPA